ncbi:serine/threonine protein kinase [Archangium violaceum]|uniref:serine/threonine protein kinase n=1 Tax=Archangium violaceum TaxID=83451 RepID=UPI00193B7A04|nr:serine/threonine-protein kinase [Archangium violaceum]QRK07383.1 serine/threonine protein kinase [Archangium violaceum]
MFDEDGGQAGRGLPWRLEPGAEVAGFIIEGPLASGSFGSVYRARRGERPFAIKLVGIEPRSNREVDALRLMRHPNVVSFHGYGFWPDEEPRSLVLALELVEGRPLDVWAKEENPSALELVMQVLLPFALTLADVHAAGVVHRDIKEANIVVREEDGQPVLVDFGAAGLEGAQRLTIRMPPGTPEYRSPEVWRFAREWEGEHYPFTPGDDLWAVGVVTYLLLTRRLPFGDGNDPDMVQAILGKTPPAPHELNPRVPPALGELCMRMLEKEPGARYADAKALAEALSEVWAQADKSWRVPLFPEPGREERPAPVPAPAPVVPERQGRGGWRRAALVLPVVLGVVTLLAPTTQRLESAPLPPPQQVTLRQELAPAKVTGEVGQDAGPKKSPTPAPVATATNKSEEPKMTKSQKTRALLSAGLVATSACAGGGGPALRPPPKPEACPPGSMSGHTRLGISEGDTLQFFIRPYNGSPSNRMIPPEEAILSEGEVDGENVGQYGEVSSRTRFRGKLIFGNGRVYGRFTEAHLNGNEVVPVCMELVVLPGTSGMPLLGAPVSPGSTSKRAIVNNALFIQAVRAFH